MKPGDTRGGFIPERRISEPGLPLFLGKDDHAIDGRIVQNERCRRRFHEPGEAGTGDGFLQKRRYRETVNNVSEGAKSDKENVHQQPSQRFSRLNFCITKGDTSH